jgi:hypothetical protein
MTSVKPKMLQQIILHELTVLVIPKLQKKTKFHWLLTGTRITIKIVLKTTVRLAYCTIFFSQNKYSIIQISQH